MPLFNKPATPGPVNWKTNLAAIWVSQFVSLSAFYFCLPFLPLYLKEKQIVSAENTAFWSGIFIAAAPVSMMIMSPIWGTLGDRYGRKMMLVRANLAGAFVLYLMSVVHNMEGLIVLRLLQGAFTGTVPSAQSLVAAGTPDRHQGFALGMLMAAINIANTAGFFFGGLFAEHFGAESAFRMSGYMLVFATFFVVVMVRENFVPPADLAARTRSARIRRRKAGVEQLKSGVPILLAIAFVAFVMTFDGPYMALYVESLLHSGVAPGAAEVSGKVYSTTGNINAIASIIAVGGSLSISYIMDKGMPGWLWGVVALAGLSGLWIIPWWESIAGLTVGRTVFLFFLSGLSSVLVVLLSRMTPNEKRGSAMGWAVTARCVGWMSAPLLGGYAAQAFGYGRAYFWLGAACFVLVPYFPWLASRYSRAFRIDDDENVPLDEVVLPPQSMPVNAAESVRLLAGALSPHDKDEAEE